MLNSLTYIYSLTMEQHPWLDTRGTIDFTGVSVDWFVQGQSPYHLFYSRGGYYLRYF
jgi:hypothetical protein